MAYTALHADRVRAAIAAMAVVAALSAAGAEYLAGANPGKLNYATSGVGAASHPAVELFKRMTGVDMVHIPYKGAGAATAAVVSGQVQLLFTSTGAASVRDNLKNTFVPNSTSGAG